MSSEPYEQVWKSIEAGDISTVRRLLKEHGNVAKERHPELQRPTLLEAATNAGFQKMITPVVQMEIVELLLDAGASADEKSLFYAASVGQLEVAKAILKRGSTIPRAKREEAMNEAYKYGFVELGDHLRLEGMTPTLSAMAGSNNAEGIRMMLESEVPLDEMERFEALFGAARSGHVAALVELLKSPQITELVNQNHPSHKCSVLHLAAWKGHRVIALELLRHGANVSLRDARHNGTPADHARQGNHLELGELLSGS